MSASLAAKPAPQTLGRFELRRLLGKGAQASVWLGFDAHLEREVAVKIIRPSGGVDVIAASQWLQEARSVSRLTHPNVVPVFEADVQEGQPFLVFEYVAGHTLSEVLRTTGAFAPQAAVATVIEILSALQAAHEAGIVHRDLKPSNVLIDSGGRARVMDFGIAVKTNDASQNNQIVGTPGYLSPEAAAGLSPTPVMDVFSAGLVLAELLAGRPVISENDPYRAIYRAAHEDQVLAGDLGADVDDALRAVVLRAMARDPARRFATAEAFSAALQAWAQPEVAVSASDAAAASNSATLDFLLRRMRHKSDFPALSDSVSRIQRVANSETESLNSLSDEILKDVALTNKLLRLVNTASYRHTGGGTISTVSRAAALVGFAGIRNMALSLVLVEHMQDKGHASLLKEEFLRSLMAGTLASELCKTGRESEEAFIGSMFQNLGRLLTEFYFPDEARQIRSLLSRSAAPGDPPRPGAENATAFQVLGLSFEELGVGVAKSWGLPDSLQRCMRKPGGEPPSRPPDTAPERMRWLAMAANDLTDTLLRASPTASASAVNGTAERYARVLGMSAKHISEATAAARIKVAETARAMNLVVSKTSPASRLLAAPAGAGDAGVLDDIDQANTDSLSPHALQASTAMLDRAGDGAAAPSSQSPGKAADILAAGVQDITNSMVDDFKLNEVLRMILETMFRALGFRRVLFCLRDPKTETLTGRFGLGEGAEAAAALFKVPLKGGTDLFAAVCLKGADTLIRDASTPAMAARLPAWYRKTVNAPSFLLLPLMMKGSPFAMIYADQSLPGGIELDDKELSLLRTLRNQAVMAFKQAS